jgi:hypothetical protein
MRGAVDVYAASPECWKDFLSWLPKRQKRRGTAALQNVTLLVYSPMSDMITAFVAFEYFLEDPGFGGDLLRDSFRGKTD